MRIPVGELIEWLGQHKFDVSVRQVNRLFIILEKAFPDGLALLSDEEGELVPDPSQLQTLKNLVSPIFSTSELEQQRFSIVFDQFNDWPLPWSYEKFLRKIEAQKNEKKLSAKLRSKQRRTRQQRLFFGPLLCLLLIWGIIIFAWSRLQYLPKFKVLVENGPKSDMRSISLDSTSQVFLGKVKWKIDQDTFSTRPSTKFNYTFKGYGWHTIKAEQCINDPLYQAFFLKRQLILVDSMPVSLDTIPTHFSKDYDPQVLSLKVLPETTKLKLQTMNVLFWFLLALTVLVALYFLFRNGLVRVKKNQDPPLTLFLPRQEHLIFIDNHVGVWVQQLLTREESRVQRIAISESIKRSIRSGGMRQLVLEPVKRKPRYLFLIDYQSPVDQQLKVVDFLIRQIRSREIDMDYFYFRGDPRLCWDDTLNNEYELEKLQPAYIDARLVLITEGSRFVDYNQQTVTSWVSELLQPWKEKVILTPLHLFNWGALQDILAAHFLLLPLSWEGRSELINFFNLHYTPDTREIAQLLRLSPVRTTNPAYWKMFTPAEITHYFYLCGVPKQSAALTQWALGLMLYPTPTWEITITIGKVVEGFYPKDKLVSIENLLHLTGLPWLKQSNLNPTWRKANLPALDGKIKEKIIECIAKLFKTLSPEFQKDSVAYEELQIRSLEIEAHSSDQRVVKKSLRGLTRYFNAGLLKDELIQEMLLKRRKRHYFLQISSLALLSAACFLFSFFNRFNVVSSRVVIIDSAIFYNNHAVSTVARDFQLDDQTTYNQARADLNRSLRLRETFVAHYNLEVLKYNDGINFSKQVTNLRENRIFSTRDKKEMNDLLRPLSVLFRRSKINADSAILQPTEMREYLRLIYDQAPPEQVLTYLQATPEFHNKEFDLDKLGFLASLDQVKQPAIISDQFVTEGKFSSHLMTIHPTRAQIDSLLMIKGLEIILYSGGVKEPVVDSNGGVKPTADQVAMINIKNIFKDLTVPYETDINSLFTSLNQKNITNLTTANLAVASECDSIAKQNIRYYWLYLDSLNKQDSLLHRFAFLPLKRNSGSYIVYFFKNDKLFQIELRLSINDYDYERILSRFNIQPAIKSRNRFYYNDGKTYAAVENSDWLGLKRILIGKANYAKFCSHDYWNK